ncbi:ABC transporter substrate-binding protein [Falsirhodobacter halotolerans]|uniref:ABC transporter substrate-binding protein n=1 Tax=Falsirhodobacter halotolerans TaxID=1146892 RepID=UPI001FD1CDDE|nr:ABC transporter substrate-binding protein [Falsirhodobacter halotolerans]MCJ8141146.1 ABC transporter substrate-binding protein [Falsirhodobacter halotolerans]
MLAASTSGALAGGRPRLAAIDWAMMETAIALGHMPVAGAELIRYRADVGQPAIPPDVVDLGLRGAPNFELLQLVRPDMILSSPYYTQFETRLRAIAPVLSLTFFAQGEPPLPRALAALSDLARDIGDVAAGARALSRTEARFDALSVELARFNDRPLALIDIGDARHMRAFGPDSLFGSTLARLHLTNARSQPTAFSFMAPVPIETLAKMPEARIIVIGPPPPAARRALRGSVLWHALPPVAEGRVHVLPPLNPFGAVPSALRFAEALVQALKRGPEEIA